VSVVSTVFFVLGWGFAVGAGARWLVPGPDPMPGWLTIAVGIAGSLAGGGAVAAFVGFPTTAGEAYSVMWATIATSLLASTGIVVAYRRFVQQRAIVGRDALRMPTSGIGVARARRLLGIDLHLDGGANGDVAERLTKLTELHDRGLVTDEEFQAKRADLIAAI
jgi:uncharacterized membrane protein YeaQ/YmgE (transglycosylase-associated protein family)